MPFFEIRFQKSLPSKYDIYDTEVEEIDSSSQGWDDFIPIDY